MTPATALQYAFVGFSVGFALTVLAWLLAERTER
jgi:hypothetical protein